MKSKDSNSLIADLVHLLERHGKERLSELAEQIRSGTLTEDMASVLEFVAAAARKEAPKRVHKGMNPGVLKSINLIGHTEPERAELAKTAFHKLSLSSEVKTRDIATWLERRGVSVSRNSKRQTLVHAAMNKLLCMTTEEIRESLAELSSERGPSNNRLDEWNDIILGRGRQRRLDE